MRFTYLLIDYLTLLFPLAFSFHKKLNFARSWIAFIPACLITAVLFIPFDMLFTRWKIWGFNPRYITGIYIANLPVEEVFFFFCIPYACVFTWHCFLRLFNHRKSPGNADGITWLLLCGSVTCLVLFPTRLYTLFTFSLLIGLLITSRYILKINWLGRFYATYAMLLIPFLIVNGLLTGTGLHSPIVWYNDRQNMGVRLLTIPVEDVFYGMDLIWVNVLIYSSLQIRALRRTLPGAGAV